MGNGQMSGTCTLMLYFGAIMNAWVVVSMSLIVYFLLGASDSVADVILDALGLAFLYNLDDVGGDLGLLDKDDWPGIQLAWLEKHADEAAHEFVDMEACEPSRLCECFLCLVTLLLVI